MDGLIIPTIQKKRFSKTPRISYPTILYLPNLIDIIVIIIMKFTTTTTIISLLALFGTTLPTADAYRKKSRGKQSSTKRSTTTKTSRLRRVQDDLSSTSMTGTSRSCGKGGSYSGKGGSSSGKGGSSSSMPCDEPGPVVDELADGGNGQLQNESNDDTLLEHICSIFEHIDEGAHNTTTTTVVDFDWYSYCDGSSSNHFLCPNTYETSKICANESPGTSSSDAVQRGYCEPLFKPLPHSARKETCIKYCINYVSMDRGGCCDFGCA